MLWGVREKGGNNEKKGGNNEKKAATMRKKAATMSGAETRNEKKATMGRDEKRQ